MYDKSIVKNDIRCCIYYEKYWNIKRLKWAKIEENLDSIMQEICRVCAGYT